MTHSPISKTTRDAYNADIKRWTKQILQHQEEISALVRKVSAAEFLLESCREADDTP